LLFGKQTTRISSKTITFLSLFIAIIIGISSCSTPKGSIVILESYDGKGASMEFKEWSSKDKYTIYLNKGDVLKFEVIHEDGEIGLTVIGQKGSEPYTGNNLMSGIFTVTVSESDNYDIQITGKDATGLVSFSK